jgi:hypothetical protein
MTTEAERRLAGLRAGYPEWDVWHVRVLIGPDVWCCKPKGAPVATRQESSPDALEKWLGDQP